MLTIYNNFKTTGYAYDLIFFKIVGDYRV